MHVLFRAVYFIARCCGHIKEPAVVAASRRTIARSGEPHAAKNGRHSAAHFVMKTKMEMPLTFSRVRHFSTFFYVNGNIATV
jgi:hypothetical protein